MDDDFTVNFLHPESDRGSGSPAAAESRSESTRWNSLESGVTVESSRWCSCESCDGEDARPSMFLFFKRALPVGKLAWNGNAMRSITISEFSVLQNGCWQKISFGTKITHSDLSSDFYFRENPLTSRSAEPSGSYTRTTAVRVNLPCNKEAIPSSDKAFSGTSLRNPVGHECSTENTAEASGQNFTDEDKEEKPSERPRTQSVEMEDRVKAPRMLNSDREGFVSCRVVSED
ncbi:PREDICTED: uncharacterized protein LOC104804374 isoform X1 [Tarenaya hassleriana]|uniref:uncharacterized protein LOC104804374 isoform X1 n=1 Tax=Tarenaya hassleriana TaxID=28532 RepID=UPI00053C16C1|nr:PREDICTED: uncharacterized protein LOC104804374 isoform X1 [Tarenaya hassleriana]